MSRYSAQLMDHFQAPRHAGPIAEPFVCGRADLNGSAPRVELYVAVVEGMVDRIGFTAFGCGVTIAACSAVTELVAQCSVDEAWRLSPQRVVRELGGVPGDKFFCVELALDALRDALEHAG